MSSSTSSSSTTRTTALQVILSHLPLASLRHQTPLLYPLFSAAPAESISSLFHLTLAALSALIYYLTPTKLRSISWQSSYVALGLSLIVSEGLVKVGGRWAMPLGVGRGLWLARTVVEAPSELARTVALFRVWRPSQTKAALASVALYGTALATGFKISLDSKIPPCYILQAHGWLLILVALFFPSPSSPPRLSPNLNPKMPKKFQAPPSQPQTLKTSSRFSTQARLQILLGTLTLTLLTSLTSRHCPLSLSPKYHSSLPFARPYNSSTSTHVILESRYSTTGLIVVAEQKLQGGHWARYLRADHSVLGGLWVGPARERVVQEMKDKGVSLWDKVDEKQVVQTAETIYSTFILQEIIRLAGDPLKQRKRGKEHGLIIGLGAGLSARALHSHGINTTLVEIDPVVFHYAVKYFGVLQPRGGTYLEDARVFLRRDLGVGGDCASVSQKYDYVIHDVFTGGTVPASLFTKECWDDIKAVLAPGGIVGVNFAGNIHSKAARLVLSTLVTSFAHCRAFQDGPSQDSFRNVVILCSPYSELRFRAPVVEDYLPYPSPGIRKRVLETFMEFEWDIRGVGRREVLRDGREGEAGLEKGQVGSAREHWEIMGKVLPFEAWAQY